MTSIHRLRSRTRLALPGMLVALSVYLNAQEPETRRFNAEPWSSEKNLASSLASDHGNGRIILKLRDGCGATLADSRFAGARNPELCASLNSSLSKRPGTRVVRALSTPTAALVAMKERAESASGRRLAELQLFFRIQVADPSQASALIEELLGMPEVENAYMEPAFRGSGDFAGVAPDFSANQGYLQPAPAGIDITSAIQAGLTGLGVRVGDVESGWNIVHEDLLWLSGQTPPLSNHMSTDWDAVGTEGNNHGTAVLGVLAAARDGSGVDGMLTQSTIRLFPSRLMSDPFWTPSNAIIEACQELKPGDVMLIEIENVLQAGTVGLPLETFDLEFHVVRQATALGIHVIMPAGNSVGGTNLDSNFPMFGISNFAAIFDLAMRDSGAIFVGGANPALVPADLPQFSTHNRYANSNFGNRVDTYAWGQNVTTTGYGPNSSTFAICGVIPSDPFPAANGPNEWYTNCFNGTSAAGAIVAGTVALLEQRHRARFGQPTPVRAMRALLRNGTGSNDRIGRQPDFAYHLPILSGDALPSLSQGPVRGLGTVGALPMFGNGLAVADFDMDGTPDVVVGIPGTDNGSVDLGQLMSWSTKSGTRLASTGNLGQFTNAALGTALVPIHDVDADGVQDILVGAPGDSNQIGRAFLFSGATLTALSVFSSSCTQGRFGEVVGVGPDLDGDTTADLGVGSPEGCLGSGEGEFEFFSSSIPNVSLRQHFGTIQGERLGSSYARLSDINGDQIPEYVIGSPGFTPAGTTGPRRGCVRIHDGATGSVIQTILGESLPSGAQQADFGAAVASIGDVTGNGRDDFAVGAPNWASVPLLPGNGAVYIFRDDGLQLTRLIGGLGPDHFGAALSAAGDFDNDGRKDLAIGSPSTADPAVNSLNRPGRVVIAFAPFESSTTVVLPFPPTTISAVPMTPRRQRRTEFAVKERRTLFGKTLASAGDLNGDRRPDVVVSEPRAAFGGRFQVISYRPTLPSTSSVLLIADLPAIEARDTDGDGFGGGGSSPSTSTLAFDAGIGSAGLPFQIDITSTVPAAAGLFTTPVFGLLDGNGRGAFTFGPFLATTLCPLIGARIDFRVTVGSGPTAKISNFASVTIINETGQCP